MHFTGKISLAARNCHKIQHKIALIVLDYIETNVKNCVCTRTACNISDLILIFA